MQQSKVTQKQIMLIWNFDRQQNFVRDVIKF